MKKCPYCGAQIADDSRFCSECGKEITQANVCPHCGASVGEGDAFCQNCGKSLNEAPSSEPITYEEEQPKRGFKKYLPYIIGGILLLGVVGYFSSKSSNEGSTNQSVVADSVGVNGTTGENADLSTEQEIERKKQFLESFYKKYDSSDEYDEAYIKSVITNKALLIMKKHYTRGEGGDMAYPNGIACWLFAYFNGIINRGSVISRNITSKDGNTFLVSAKYENVENYEVELTVIKEGGSYKIDDIKPIGLEEIEQESSELVTDDDLDNSSSNISSSSRTFYSEQIVIGYLANQSFRASDGLTMRVDGDGRLYVDGDYAGVLSVLRYSSTAALLRYGGGMYGEGKLTVNIVGDKFTLTDPTDGTVYYQR